jgi:hypothetical protein
VTSKRATTNIRNKFADSKALRRLNMKVTDATTYKHTVYAKLTFTDHVGHTIFPGGTQPTPAPRIRTCSSVQRQPALILLNKHNTYIIDCQILSQFALQGCCMRGRTHGNETVLGLHVDTRCSSSNFVVSLEERDLNMRVDVVHPPGTMLPLPVVESLVTYYLCPGGV